MNHQEAVTLCRLVKGACPQQAFDQYTEPHACRDCERCGCECPEVCAWPCPCYADEEIS